MLQLEEYELDSFLSHHYQHVFRGIVDRVLSKVAEEEEIDVGDLMDMRSYLLRWENWNFTGRDTRCTRLLPLPFPSSSLSLVLQLVW